MRKGGNMGFRNWMVIAALCFFPLTKAFALDTNLYEKEPDKIVSFSSKVRVVREIEGDTEVFFESDQAHGGYILPHSLKDYAAALEALQTSEKGSGPQVTVSVDEDTKTIKSVQKPAAPAALDPVKDFDKIFH
jgi:hypothetical protein